MPLLGSDIVEAKIDLRQIAMKIINSGFIGTKVFAHTQYNSDKEEEKAVMEIKLVS